jgi:hypothetical protein
MHFIPGTIVTYRTHGLALLNSGSYSQLEPFVGMYLSDYLPRFRLNKYWIASLVCMEVISPSNISQYRTLLFWGSLVLWALVSPRPLF